jgi:hypothetical protein
MSFPSPLFCPQESRSLRLVAPRFVLRWFGFVMIIFLMANNDDTRQYTMKKIDAALLAGQDQCLHNLILGIMGRARSEGADFDKKVATEYFWDLARSGVVAITGGSGAGIPELLLTERGRKLLEAGERSPHNLSRYMNSLKAHVSSGDDVALSYAEEAGNAWLGG